MSGWIDLLCLWLGRAVACAGGCALAVYLAARCVDIALSRAGMTGLMLKFAFAECRKAPRSFWGRLLWGAKEPEES